MKTITILIFTIILSACGASNKANSNFSDDTMKNTQETLNGTFIVTKLGTKDLSENLTLNFDSTKNKVSGFSGCNSFSGEYTLAGNAVKIGKVITTKKYCKNLMDTEQHFLKALQDITTFSMKENILSLKNEKENLIEAKAEDNTKSKKQNATNSIEYRASTRGFYTLVIIKNNSISVQKDRNAKKPAEIKKLSEKEINQLKTLLENIDLSKLSEYEGPTKKRHFDGAAHATLKITTLKGETYVTPSFDHGYPNSNIETFVNAITNMAETHK